MFSNKPTSALFFRLSISIYNLLWKFCLPFLLLSKRLGPNLKKRLGSDFNFKKADIWIQAASVGESYLASEIITSWPKDKPINLLITTNTNQGMEVLESIKPVACINLTLLFCPLDTKSKVSDYLDGFQPKALVLLETEIWPNLIQESKKRNIPIILLNGRMSVRSLARYFSIKKLLSYLSPDEVWAVSEKDANRFDYIFEHTKTYLMPNIKFDRCSIKGLIPYVQNPLSKYFKAQTQLIVFGSIRKEEEILLLPVIERIIQERPRAILAIFPRHLHRIQSWKEKLEKRNLSCELRSNIKNHVSPGTIVLWDKFGELESAYALARAVFVGGTLAPLGGQNFLEPLNQGITPCIGPSWENFSWIGQEIINQGLVQQIENTNELGDCLVHALKNPQSRENVHSKFKDYIIKNQGGNSFAIEKISSYL